MSTSSSGEDSDRPTKAVTHFVGARLIKVRQRNTLSGWSAVFSFACIIGAAYMAYVGWSTCNYYGIFARLIKGYDASLIPWLASVIGTMMAVIFLSGTLLCTITVTSYVRVSCHHLMNLYMYALYACLMTIVLVAALAALHIIFLKNAFKGSLEDSLNKYGNDTQIRSAIDRLQIDLKCCGSSSYTDWWNAEWYSTEYVDINSPQIQAKMHGSRFLTDDVPFSCCNPEAMRPCVHHAMTNVGLHYNYVIEDVTVYTNGCAKALHLYFSRTILLNVVASSAWILIALIPLLIFFRYLQTSTMTAIGLGDPYAPARGYLWVRRRLFPPTHHSTKDKDVAKKPKKRETKRKTTEKLDSGGSARKPKKSKHSHHRSLHKLQSTAESSSIVESSSIPTHSNDTDSIAEPYSPIYQNSAAPSPVPYTGRGDAYSQYYQKYINSIYSERKTNDPDTKQNNAPSEDMYDEIDPDHQPITAVPSLPLDRPRKTSLDRILNDQIPEVYQSGHKERTDAIDENEEKFEAMPTDNIYDEIGQVQPVSAVPVLPTMRNNKPGEFKPPPLQNIDTKTATMSTIANQESIYLEPVKAEQITNLYQNIPITSARNRPTVVDSTYLMPQIHQSQEATPSNKYTQRTIPQPITAAESEYMVPRVATEESAYMVPLNARTTTNQIQGNGTYVNIDHVATLKKKQNANESYYLQPENIANTKSNPNTDKSDYLKPVTSVHESIYLQPQNMKHSQAPESVYLAPQTAAARSSGTKAAESIYQPLLQRDAGPGVYDSLRKTSNPNTDKSDYMKPVTSVHGSVYLQPQNMKHSQAPESVYLAPQTAAARSSGTKAAESIYQPLLQRDAGPRVYDSLRKTSRPQVKPTGTPPQHSTYQTLRSTKPSSERVYQTLDAPHSHAKEHPLVEPVTSGVRKSKVTILSPTRSEKLHKK